MTSTKANTGLLATGVVIIVVGVLAAAGLWYTAGQRYDDAVRGLARAPVGCDTTLDFAETGTYFLFVETTGAISDVTGNCDAVTEYDSNRDEVPSVRLTMWDPSSLELLPDQAMALDRNSTTTYDAAGFVGQSIRSVDVTTAGDHVLRVESSASSASSAFAVAVGRDPSEGVGILKLGAALAALIGVVGGVILIVMSTRRRPESGEVSTIAAWPNDAWVTTPPVAAPVPSASDWHPVVGPPSEPPTVPGRPPTGPPTAPPSHEPAHEPAQAPAILPTWPPTPPAAGDDDGRSPWAPPTGDQ
jgi:hypothetical protein